MMHPKRKANSEKLIELPCIDLMQCEDDEENESENEDVVSEYSTQSFDSADLQEGAVNETNWAEIEYSNSKGVSRALLGKSNIVACNQ